MNKLEDLLQNNRNWATKIKESDPQFFHRLSQQQTPALLWIGCSDSRVPANQIVGLPPGEIFVHRNVANVVVHTDLNCLSVIQFAVEVLKVTHIIVCGHYGCGGVRAALTKEKLGLIQNWLRHIQDVEQNHREELESLTDFSKKCDRLCELNIQEQVKNVVRTTIIQDAWERGQELNIHGWIYSIQDGLLKSLGVDMNSAG